MYNVYVYVYVYVYGKGHGHRLQICIGTIPTHLTQLQLSGPESLAAGAIPRRACPVFPTEGSFCAHAGLV